MRIDTLEAKNATLTTTNTNLTAQVIALATAGGGDAAGVKRPQ
jgi:hypothetical protein